MVLYTVWDRLYLSAYIKIAIGLLGLFIANIVQHIPENKIVERKY